ncbi:helix-turn-helix transcriptional regulator [Sinorhizobium meliloti]|uniref:helix-turn-helix transcriptional regulator n=1 Tax=Rhizobium meliloti TaxID=382 RepID=UPI002D21E38F|nr:helix-turn-helix transcriptional regulator [Sinorhizobium meliloti]
MYRLPPPDGRIRLSATLEERISASIREARERRNLSRSKLAPLLGLSEAVYARYKTSVSLLTVGRLIHRCERRPQRRWRGGSRAIASAVR